jgi:hypothetical protein
MLTGWRWMAVGAGSMAAVGGALLDCTSHDGAPRASGPEGPSTESASSTEASAVLRELRERFVLKPRLPTVQGMPP